jgi:hypothetical protein
LRQLAVLSVIDTQYDSRACPTGRLRHVRELLHSRPPGWWMGIAAPEPAAAH